MIDAVMPSLNTLYSQRFKGSIGYQAATKVTDQGLSGSNSYYYESMEVQTIETHYKGYNFRIFVAWDTTQR